MANAIPVGRPAQEQRPEVKPVVKPVEQHDESYHKQFEGKDHPEFGKWHGSGWHKQGDVPHR
jgi:hypothetical protein